MRTHVAAIQTLSAVDRVLDTRATLRSLCPGRARPTPLATIAEALLGPELEPPVVTAFARALGSVAEAILASFPGNLFWDLDYFATSLLACCTSPGSADERARCIEERACAVTSLQKLFSHQSRIQFRYAHDFLYGFDWAKWVARSAEERADVGPFAPEFLRGMQQRGGELLELIAQNDRTYPRVASGRDRNPFGFSREPEAEELLHRDLAEHGLLPFAAWSFDARPVWNEPFAELRRERARALGLESSAAISSGSAR